MHNKAITSIAGFGCIFISGIDASFLRPQRLVLGLRRALWLKLGCSACCTRTKPPPRLPAAASSAEPLAAMSFLRERFQSLDAGAAFRVAELHQSSLRNRIASGSVQAIRIRDAREPQESWSKARCIPCARSPDIKMLVPQHALGCRTDARERAPSTRHGAVTAAFLRARSLHGCTLSRRETIPRAGPRT